MCKFICAIFGPKIFQNLQFIKYQKISNKNFQCSQFFMNNCFVPHCPEIFILHTNQITYYLTNPPIYLGYVIRTNQIF